MSMQHWDKSTSVQSLRMCFAGKMLKLVSVEQIELDGSM